MNFENKLVPPLSDPAQWRLFVGNTINEENAMSAQLRDQWHINELHGNKFMAMIVIGLFEKYGLSQSWSNALLRVFLSNEYQKRISKAQGLLEHLVAEFGGKRGTSDPLEVAPSFPIAHLLVYFAALRKDPLYLFTRASSDTYLSILLEEALRPLLEYAQELYASPIRLDGWPTMDYPYMKFHHDEIVLRAKNFTYDRPKSYDSNASHICQVLNTIVPGAALVKKGLTTTLTVHIPKRHDHPFWHRTSYENTGKLFSWDVSEDALSFQVTRWGPLDEYSRFYATQRAKDIIRNNYVLQYRIQRICLLGPLE